MKKDMCKRFVDFKARHSLSNVLIVEIVKEYANSDLDFARTYYSEKYNISNHTFYTLRDYAIIFCLVDTDTCKKLQKKSTANYSRNNASNSAKASIAHYNSLLEKRQRFLNSFSSNEIKDIALKYVEGVDVEKIAIAYDTGAFAIKYLLKKGIVSLILDANIVNSIRLIVGEDLDKILQERESNKQLLLNCLQKQIAFLKSQITCYDLYYREVQNKPTLSSLQKNLLAVIHFHKETLQL